MAKVPRVLIFPYPEPGHTQPFLRLATLLADAGLEVVFLSTEYDHRRIVNMEALTSRFPTLQFESIFDGIPIDRPRDLHDFIFYFNFRDKIKPSLREVLRNLNADSSRQISFMIVDVITSGPIEVAEELGIPVFCFCPCSARYLLLHFLIPQLIQSAQIPYSDDDDLKEITGLDSFEGGTLRRKDLPGHWKDFNSMSVIDQMTAAGRSSGIILNTFDELESPFLTKLSTIFNKIYTIGPLHALSNSKVGSIGVILKSDESCIPWLDSQPSKSVIFASFGSSGKMKAEELTEFWYGLVNSGKPFICALRTNMVRGEANDELVKKLVEEGGQKVKGIVVDWAPQEKVLNHPSVGGFLTHCGWNSVLECVTAGVPMICWPIIGDQFSNSIWIEKGWKVGLEIDKKWDRKTVEDLVRALLDDPKGGEMFKSVQKLSNLANQSVSEGGLSFKNFEKLVQDIKMIATK